MNHEFSDGPPQKRRSRLVVLLIGLLIVGIVLWLLIRVIIGQFIASPTFLRTYAMSPTIRNGEVVLTVILPAWRGEIKRGSLLYYRAYNGDKLISRVIGLAGDKIEMKGGLALVNGEESDDPDVISALRAAKCIDESLYINNFAQLENQDRAELRKVIVPANRYFVLADNRSEEWEDSRYLGSISPGQIIGVVQLTSQRSLSTLKHEDCVRPKASRP